MASSMASIKFDSVSNISNNSWIGTVKKMCRRFKNCLPVLDSHVRTLLVFLRHFNLKILKKLFVCWYVRCVLCIVSFSQRVVCRSELCVSVSVYMCMHGCLSMCVCILVCVTVYVCGCVWIFVRESVPQSLCIHCMFLQGNDRVV